MARAIIPKEGGHRFMARAIIPKEGGRGFMARAIIPKEGGHGFMARAIIPKCRGKRCAPNSTAPRADAVHELSCPFLRGTTRPRDRRPSTRNF
jgi:hypothetical protein